MNRILSYAAVLAGALSLPAPSQVIEKSVAITWDFSNQPLPTYSGGFLLARDEDGSTVRMFDASGAVVKTFKLVLPDASYVRVRNAIVSPAGELVALASALDQAGRAASVLAWFDESGGIRRLVRTTPFAPSQIVFSANGDLWAVGRLHDSELKDVPGHDILRQYDREGRLLKSALPRDSFNTPRWHPTRDSQLVCGKDRIGLYSPHAAEWIELSLSGDVLGRWRTPKFPEPPEGEVVLGAAIAASGDVYFSTFYTKSGQRDPGTALYRLDKSSGTFTSVVQSPVTGELRDGLLLGAEGEHLVFYWKSSPQGRSLNWVVLVQREMESGRTR